MKIYCPKCLKYEDSDHISACGYDLPKLASLSEVTLYSMYLEAENNRQKYTYLILASGKGYSPALYEFGVMLNEGKFNARDPSTSKEIVERAIVTSSKLSYYPATKWLINNRDNLSLEAKEYIDNLEKEAEEQFKAREQEANTINGVLPEDEVFINDIIDCFNRNGYKANFYDLGTAYLELKKSKYKSKSGHKLNNDQMKMILSFAFICKDIKIIGKVLSIKNPKTVFKQIDHLPVIPDDWLYNNEKYGIYVGNKKTGYGAHSKYSKHYYNKH